MLCEAAMIAFVHSAVISGIEAQSVRVEVDLRSSGLPGWNMVGLLETAVKESRDRVTSAVKSAGFSVPVRRTIINLSPANLKKSGTHYDLPIAIALLCTAQACRNESASKYLMAGELSLDGRVCPISGVLIMAATAKECGLEGIIVPEENFAEAELVWPGNVIGVNSLGQTVSFLNSGERPNIFIPATKQIKSETLDLSEVKGQPLAKRGLEIAAAGGHNLAMAGPPGTGKTMLAERLPSILPPLSDSEAMEVMKIKSVHGLLRFDDCKNTVRPFRAPHHSASYAGLVGGGMSGAPRLGEISLAHRGVLFLDELAEFRRDVLEVLRQPLESGTVSIVRAGISLSYPAKFMLVGAFNPCRCGYFTHPERPCTCSVAELKKYRAKLAGPLFDRIDIHVEVGPPPHESLIEAVGEVTSQEIKKRVITAREIQEARLGKGFCNAMLKSKELYVHAKLGSSQKTLLKQAAKKLFLSGRSIHRIIKVSRTIADLDNSPDIRDEHIAEGIGFRSCHDKTI